MTIKSVSHDLKVVPKNDVVAAHRIFPVERDAVLLVNDDVV
jgi:hypothetical protein